MDLRFFLIDRVIHYTSNLNWRHAYIDGTLDPLTPANFLVDDLSKRVCDLYKGKTFLVCLEEKDDPRWVEYGLMDFVIQHTTGEVTLSVPLDRAQGGVVRDHSYFSPKIHLEKFGKNYFALEGASSYTPEDHQNIVDTLREYYESSVSLDEYDGNFKVPEIWLPQHTLVEKIIEV